MPVLLFSWPLGAHGSLNHPVVCLREVRHAYWSPFRRRAGKSRRGNGCRSLRYEALESRQLLSVIPIQVTQGDITVQENCTSYNSSLDKIAVQLTGLQGPAAGSSVIDLLVAWTAVGGTLSLASDAAVAAYNADNGANNTWQDFTSGTAGSRKLAGGLRSDAAALVRQLRVARRCRELGSHRFGNDVYQLRRHLVLDELVLVLVRGQHAGSAPGQQGHDGRGLQRSDGLRLRRRQY